MKRPKQVSVVTWEKKPRGCPFVFQFEPIYFDNNGRLVLKNLFTRIYPERSKKGQNFAGYIGYETCVFELNCTDGYNIKGTIQLQKTEDRNSIGIKYQFTHIRSYEIQISFVLLFV